MSLVFNHTLTPLPQPVPEDLLPLGRTPEALLQASHRLEREKSTLARTITGKASLTGKNADRLMKVISGCTYNCLGALFFFFVSHLHDNNTYARGRTGSERVRHP